MVLISPTQKQSDFCNSLNKLLVNITAVDLFTHHITADQCQQE